MKELIIDLQKIRDLLPKHAQLSIGKTTKGTKFISIVVESPSLYAKGTAEEEQNIRLIRTAIREIIGNDNIMEIYAESEGTPWIIYLRPKFVTFENL